MAMPQAQVEQRIMAGAPNPERSRLLTGSERTDAALAKEVLEFHDSGLRSRRQADLTAEKYFLHLDGEGNGQWFDLYNGTRLRMPARIGGAPRFQDNQLRPIVDNWVAHLTTQEYRFVAEGRQDRESRERALVDQALINQTCRDQHWNVLWQLAKYTAACAGWCPVHAMVRQDQGDPYDLPVGASPGQDLMQPVRRVSMDNFCGNPLDTVLSGGSRRDSIYRATYGRVIPAALVNQAFGRTDLRGSDKLPSAANFQRLGARWLGLGGQVHGSAILTGGRGNEELLGLIYDEVPPGLLSDYPNGRLCVVALQGSAGTSKEEGRTGTPILLWCDDLPGGRLSFVSVLAKNRFDSPYGKPFVADLDDDQVQYNQLETIANEWILRASKPPLGSTGPVSEDTLGWRQDTLLELAGQIDGGGGTLEYLRLPADHMQHLTAKVDRILQGMYRKGGWQAASRGESHAGESGKQIIALQTADDSIFGPDEKQTKRELEGYAQLNRALYQEFLDVPVLVDTLGADLAHLAEPYVDRTMMSEHPPTFVLTSGWGSSPMARAQQLLNLFGMRDAKGRELVDVPLLRRAWPDPGLFGETVDADAAREQRARVVNKRIAAAAKQMRALWSEHPIVLSQDGSPLSSAVARLKQQFAQVPEIPNEMGDPVVQACAQYLALIIDHQHPVLMDDDLEANLNTLSVLTQDESEDALVRQAAVNRQGQYWQHLARRQAAQAQAQQPQPRPQPKPGEASGRTPAMHGEQPGASQAQSMVNADRASTRQPQQQAMA